MRTQFFERVEERQRDLFLLVVIFLVQSSMMLHIMLMAAAPLNSNVTNLRYYGSAVLGTVLFVIIQKYGIGAFAKFRWSYLAAAAAVCWVALIPWLSSPVSGACRWIRFPALPVTLHSGITALTLLLIFVAALLQEKDYSPGRKEKAIIIALYLLITVALLKQPDVPTLIMLGIITLFLLFGLKCWKMGIVFLVGWVLFFLPVIIREPYRYKRVISFLNPYADPLGVGYQLVQSFKAFRTGGMFGVISSKFPDSIRYLPSSGSDFVFGLIGEAFGFMGVVLVSIAFVLFTYYGLKAAQRAYSRFEALLTLLFAMLIELFAIAHMAVTTGLVPTFGEPLPFISRSGIMMVISLATAGLIYRQLGNETPGKDLPCIKKKCIMTVVLVLQGCILARAESMAFGI